MPHTHWDREWYLPFEGFMDHLVRMMDTLLDLADRGFPHFHLDGQTAMIDDYLAVRPERTADVERHARAGRLSVGPWFTQMDEFLVSGESLIRNLERGMARAEELGAEPVPGYLPDEFGHVGQMPQILANAGIEHAVVWRGVPASVDRTAFLWEAPDGSRVLAEYLAFGYGLGGGLRDAQEPAALAHALARIAEMLEPFSAREGLLVMAGADHHGPDPTLPERLAKANEEGNAVQAHIGSVAGHVRGEPRDDVPVWRGELRSSARAHLLPGVYSTRIHQKRERARVEALVERYAEPLAALVPGFEWPEATFDRIWQLLLWNGAHDSVCGCSVDEVARAVDVRLAEARELAEGVADRALAALGERVASGGTVTFNPSPFERFGVPGLGWTVHDAPILVPPAGAFPSVQGDRILAGDETGHIIGIRLLDEADVGDLYNFCPADGDAPRPPGRLEAEPSGVLAEWEGLACHLAVEPWEGGSLRMRATIQNERPDHRLRLSIELPEPVERVVAGSPFELVERGLVSEGSDLEAPSPTWPARGVILAGGLAVVAEGVVEYEVVDGRDLAITLLRCVGTISRPSLATRPWPAGPDSPTPDGQMIGETRLTLAILPTAKRQDLLPAWERLALPLRSARAAEGGTLPPAGSLLEVSGAELSSVRRREGAVEVRLWNPSKEPKHARVGDLPVELGPARIETVRLPG